MVWMRESQDKPKAAGCTEGVQKKNVAPGWVRILAQPRQPRAYQTLPRDYVSGCKLKALQPIPENLCQRSSAHVKSSDPACQVLILNLIETCPFHKERELSLVRKLLHRRR